MTSSVQSRVLDAVCEVLVEVSSAMAEDAREMQEKVDAGEKLFSVDGTDVTSRAGNIIGSYLEESERLLELERRVDGIEDDGNVLNRVERESLLHLFSMPSVEEKLRLKLGVSWRSLCSRLIVPARRTAA